MARARKRKIPRAKQLRNVGYLVLIAMMLLAACCAGSLAVWLLFAATAFYFWPQGHYGERGVR